jgi:hypothetical protein
MGLAIALTISAFEQFQVLGRHLAVFFPLLLMLPMLYPKDSFTPKSLRNTAVAMTALGLVWAVSDLRLVFMPRYAKDSYREACSIASAKALEDGGAVVWAADTSTARYYGVLVMASNRTSSAASPDGIDLPVRIHAVDPQGWDYAQAHAFLESSPVPVILVLSKADPFDRKGTWRSLIQEWRPQEITRLNAFSIYEWPAKRVASVRNQNLGDASRSVTGAHAY